MPSCLIRFYFFPPLPAGAAAFAGAAPFAPAAGAVTGTNGIPGLKAAMELEGFLPGLPRRPLLPAKPGQRDELAQIFRRMNSELSELS